MKAPNPPDTPERKANEARLVQKLTTPTEKPPMIKIDSTLNINVLITAGSLLVTGALAYATLDKRISLLEQQTAAAVQMASERAGETRDTLREVRSDLKELTITVNKGNVAAAKDRK